MATTYAYSGTLTIIECANCHMDFGVTPRFAKDRRDDHATFYCPRGHHNFYPQKSDEEKLRDELEREQRRLVNVRARLDQAEADAEHQKARVRGYQGALVKTKRRAANGVCPVPGCQRSFANVAEHVWRQHPTYDPHSSVESHG